MKNFPFQSLSFLLVLYFTFLIIFKMHYMFLVHAVNLLVVVNFAFLMIVQKHRIQFNAIIGGYALFTFIALASSLWAVNFDNSAFKSLQLFIILINMIIVYNSMKKFNLQNTFAYGILLGSFINYILILGIVPAPFPIIDQWGQRYFGTLGNANVLSILMIITIAVSILLLNKKKEFSTIFVYYQYINIILAMYMIMLSMSKKGILFGIMLVSIYALSSFKSLSSTKNMIRFSIVSLLGLVVFFNFINIDDLMHTVSGIERRFLAFESQMEGETKFGSSGERLYFIRLGFDLFTDKPLFGYGLDNFRQFAHTYSHNNYIELLVGVGLTGTMIYYSIHMILATKIFKMEDLFLKIIFFTVIVIALLMDIAMVSYKNRYMLFFMIYIAVYVEINIRQRLEE